jgi:drug/metabolite transporter (DMT)-like permease
LKQNQSGVITRDANTSLFRHGSPEPVASHPQISMPNRSPLQSALPLVVVLTLVWGTTWVLFPYAVKEVSVWTFRAVSVTFAGLSLLAIAALRGLPLSIPRASWPTLVGAALVYLVIWNIASTFAAVLIPSGQAAILGFTMPLWATLIAWAFWGERPSLRLGLAVALGGVGVGLLLARSASAYANAPLGFALGLLAALGWALGTLLLKRRPIEAPALVHTGWQLLVAAVPITAAALYFGDGMLFMPSWPSIAVITYIALMPMALGNVVWFSIVRVLPANVAALSSVMVPVVAMIVGALVHREPLGLIQGVAMVCCAAGLLLALTKPGQVVKTAA